MSVLAGTLSYFDEGCRLGAEAMEHQVSEGVPRLTFAAEKLYSNPMYAGTNMGCPECTISQPPDTCSELSFSIDSVNDLCFTDWCLILDIVSSNDGNVVG